MSAQNDHLTNLPNDLITTIAADFDLADLCSLRLTSHNLRAIATTPNFEARFHSLRTDLSEASLQSLVAICSSAGLGYLVKEVIVLAKHYDDKKLRQQVEEGLDWTTEDVPAPFFHSTGRRMSHEERAAAQNEVDQIAFLREKQAAVQADGNDVKLFAQALNHLGSRQISLSIEAAVHTRPDGPRQPISACRDEAAMTQTTDDTFKATITAVNQSTVQVNKFNVFNMQWGGYVSLKGLHEGLSAAKMLSAPRSDEAPGPFHNIEALTLNLYTPPFQKIGVEAPDPIDNSTYPKYGPNSPPELHDTYLSSLAALFCTTANQLQDLRIRFRGPFPLLVDRVTVFNRLAVSGAQFPSLKRLHLHNVLIENSDLLALLRSAPALTQLGLHKVSLPHSPAHPQKRVEVPTFGPQRLQTEPDVEGGGSWDAIFRSFLTPKHNEATLEQTTVRPICPHLEILEINSLHLSSFRERVYLTEPSAAISAWKDTIRNNETMRKHFLFKVEAFTEGLACCVFTGAEVRGEIASPEAKTERRGIQYKHCITMPIGSRPYWWWYEVWEPREYGSLGCDPAIAFDMPPKQ